MIREDSLQNEEDKSKRRTDLTIQWDNEHIAHIEVKINDLSLEKTFETSDLVERNYSNGNNKEFRHFILMRENGRIYWEATDVKPRDKHLKIQFISWENVFLSLRKSIIESNENQLWKSWALTLMGSIAYNIFRIIKFEAEQILSNLENNLKLVTLLNGGKKMEDEEFLTSGILKYHNSRIVITKFQNDIWYLLDDIFNSYVTTIIEKYEDKIKIENANDYRDSSAFPKADSTYSIILNWKYIQVANSSLYAWAIGIRWKEGIIELITGQLWNHPIELQPASESSSNYKIEYVNKEKEKGAWILTKEYTPKLISRESLIKEFFSLMDEYLKLLLKLTSQNYEADK